MSGQFTDGFENVIELRARWMTASRVDAENDGSGIPGHDEIAYGILTVVAGLVADSPGPR